MSANRFSSPRTIIREFCLNTSTHGLPGIARSENIFNCLFWSISTAAFFGISIFFVTQSIQNYFTYPSQTLVTITTEWPVRFPAFTLCNACPLRFDRFIGPFSSYMASRNINISTDINLFDRYHASFVNDYISMKLQRNETLYETYSLETMLISCTFNSIPCNASDFTDFISAKYGSCYTFNARRKGLPGGGIRDSNVGGNSGMLKLQIYTHSHQCVPFTADAYGIMALVHDNIEAPQVDISSMGLGSSKKHLISFTKKNSYALPPPYSLCNDSIPYALQLILDSYQDADYEYSNFLCYATCAQRYIYEQCSCISPIFRNVRILLLPATNEIISPPICSFSNPCYRVATDYYIKNPKIYIPHCPYCPNECKKVTMNLVSNAMMAPPSWLLNDIKMFAENSSVPLPTDWNMTWRSHIENSYVAIDLNRESNYVENFTQVASLSGLDVLSNIGGQTGLWIGISFLSLFEFIEMLYRLLVAKAFLVYSCLKKRRSVTAFM